MLPTCPRHAPPTLRRRGQLHDAPDLAPAALRGGRVPIAARRALRVGAAGRPLVAADVEPDPEAARRRPGAGVRARRGALRDSAARRRRTSWSGRRVCDEYDVPLRGCCASSGGAVHAAQPVEILRLTGAPSSTRPRRDDGRDVARERRLRRRRGAVARRLAQIRRRRCRALVPVWRPRRQFEACWHKLRRIAAALGARHADSSLEPAEPTCASASAGWPAIRGARRARDAAAAQTGAVGFRKLRSGDGGGEPFFEWTLGPNNLDVDDDVFLEAGGIRRRAGVVAWRRAIDAAGRALACRRSCTSRGLLCCRWGWSPSSSDLLCCRRSLSCTAQRSATDQLWRHFWPPSPHVTSE